MAADLEAEGRDIIHMGIGEPDFTAPNFVVEAAQRAMAEGKLRYTSALGVPELRQAISNYYQTTFGLTVPASRIVVTAGASAALLLAVAALVEPKAEVLMPDPCYPCNRHFVAAFEGVAKLVPCGPGERFQLSDAMVHSNWSSATRGVLLASPSNPTGTSIEHDELAKIIATVREHQGFTIVDEIYQGLSYEGAPFSALSLGDDVVVINSFSKYFNMTGWRLGWLVVPDAMVPAIEKLAQNLFICPSSIAQYAAIACFSEPAIAIFEQRKEELKRRRDYLVPALRKMGFGIPVTPDGAFYIYADCSAFSDDADAFAREVLREAGVAFVPGLDFGEVGAQRYVRISYVSAMDRLEQAMERLAAYLQKKSAR